MRSKPKRALAGIFSVLGRILALAALISAVQPGLSSAAPKRPVATPGKPASIDWDQVTKEATDLLSQSIRINTVNPPGDELPAARLLREKFLANGIPATVFEPAPGRGIVAARLHGIGHHTKAIVLLSHLDVVPADPSQWSVPPFSGEVRDGYIWGRGALDDKGPGVVEAMAMLVVKRMGVLLDRDVLFLATGDEEEGGKLGAGWVLKQRPDLFSDAGYLLNEGGGIVPLPQGRKLYAVSVTEKSPLWLKLTTIGPAGHAAVPPRETAITRLLRALRKIASYRWPIRVVGPVQRYFRALAPPGRPGRRYANLALGLRDDRAFREQFLASPSRAAQVQDTVAITVLAAGSTPNVIAPAASAELDCRLLPGERGEAFLATLRRVISDPRVKFDVLLNFTSGSSPTRSYLMNAIKSMARRDHDATVVPTMIAGFTDSHYFRDRGIVSYGFIPLELTSADLKTVHGVNERLSVNTLRDGIQRMVELLTILGGRHQ